MSNTKLIFENRVHIRPTKVVVTRQCINPPNKSKHQLTHHQNFKSNTTDGTISNNAKNRIETVVSWLVALAKNKQIDDFKTGKKFYFKINFITLTLPAEQQHSDKQLLKECFQPWIDLMRKKHGLRNYVWKAETQVNGNIHWHITTDCYIHYEEVQRTWNMQLSKLGYIERFHDKHKHYNPHSTEIKAVRNVKKLANYMAKYMSKNRSFAKVGELHLIDGVVHEVPNNQISTIQSSNKKKSVKIIGSMLSTRLRKVDCKLWYLSRTLSKLKSITVSQSDVEYNSFCDIISAHTEKQIDKEYFSLMYGQYHDVLMAVPGEAKQFYKARLRTMAGD